MRGVVTADGGRDRLDLSARLDEEAAGGLYTHTVDVRFQLLSHLGVKEARDVVRGCAKRAAEVPQTQLRVVVAHVFHGIGDPWAKDGKRPQCWSKLPLQRVEQGP